MTVRMLKSRNHDGRRDAHGAPAAPNAAAAEPAPDSDLPGNDTLDGLARMAGVGRLAGEAADSAGARDTLEELLTHEIVAGHAFAMNVLCQANNQFLGIDSRAADFDHLSRLNATTAATGLVGVRMMETVQRGILLLDRLRHGVRYSYTVEYVGSGRGRRAGICPAPDSPAPGSNNGSEHAPDDARSCLHRCNRSRLRRSRTVPALRSRQCQAVAERDKSNGERVVYGHAGVGDLSRFAWCGQARPQSRPRNPPRRMGRCPEGGLG